MNGQKPQKGRGREFIQFNADILGETSPAADAANRPELFKLEFGFRHTLEHFLRRWPNHERAAEARQTLDQLYLALRLAGIEQHVEANEPIPFIVDDALINFDDERAGAALDLLADLSEKTQVVFFTHHSHLLELARQRIGSGTLFEHRLER